MNTLSILMTLGIMLFIAALTLFRRAPHQPTMAVPIWRSGSRVSRVAMALWLISIALVLSSAVMLLYQNSI